MRDTFHYLVLVALLNAISVYAHAGPQLEAVKTTHGSLRRWSIDSQNDNSIDIVIDHLVDYTHVARRISGGEWSKLTYSQRNTFLKLIRASIRQTIKERFRDLKWYLPIAELSSGDSVSILVQANDDKGNAIQIVFQFISPSNASQVGDIIISERSMVDEIFDRYFRENMNYRRVDYSLKRISKLQAATRRRGIGR